MPLPLAIAGTLSSPNENSATAEPPAGDGRARLRWACQQFESIFLAQLLKRMRATVPKGGLLGDTREQQLLRELLDEHLASRLAESGQAGLAETMYRQIAARLFPDEDSAAADTEGATSRLKPLDAPAEDNNRGLRLHGRSLLPYRPGGGRQ